MVSIVALSILACQVGGISLGDSRTIRGSGNVAEETRAVSGITGVNLATIGHLFIEMGDTESLRIEAEDNLMEYLETEVSSGRLRIGTNDDIRLDTKRPVNYYLTVTGLDTIVISSSGDIEAPDLEAERFSITINSSGNLEMGVLNADTLEVGISSSGNLDIAGGEVKTQSVTISSSGNYAAQDLESAEAEVYLNSAGSATVWVQDHLKAILSSSGDLHYRGNPTVDATTNSSGEVTQIGE
jgi:hypothetical protein